MGKTRQKAPPDKTNTMNQHDENIKATANLAHIREKAPLTQILKKTPPDSKMANGGLRRKRHRRSDKTAQK